MTTETAILSIPILCPKNCGRELGRRMRFNDMGEPPVDVLACSCCDTQYRMPTLELEIVPPDEGLAPTEG